MLAVALARTGHSDEAMTMMSDALSRSKETQEAKSWELRAATSLARLRRDQGKHKQARQFLAPVYDWFTKGFETPDLQEARELIEEKTLPGGATS